MKKWSLENPKVRFALALGSAIGLGQGITRAASENLGMAAGLFIGAAASAVLALGFSLILEGIARSKRAAVQDERGA